MIVEELINLLQHQNPKANVELWIIDETNHLIFSDQVICLNTGVDPDRVIIEATTQ